MTPDVPLFQTSVPTRPQRGQLEHPDGTPDEPISMIRPVTQFTRAELQLIDAAINALDNRSPEKYSARAKIRQMIAQSSGPQQ